MRTLSRLVPLLVVLTLTLSSAARAQDRPAEPFKIFGAEADHLFEIMVESGLPVIRGKAATSVYGQSVFCWTMPTVGRTLYSCVAELPTRKPIGEKQAGQATESGAEWLHRLLSRPEYKLPRNLRPGGGYYQLHEIDCRRPAARFGLATECTFEPSAPMPQPGGVTSGN